MKRLNEAPALSPTYIIASITTLVGLFLTQGLIDNNTSKLVSGLAVVLVPPLLAIAHALFAGRVKAAQIAAAGGPVGPAGPPGVAGPPR